MMLFAVGVNHRTAPLALREQLQLSPDEIAAALRGLTGSIAREACILSTCNRTELYAVPARDDIGGDELIAALRALRAEAALEPRHFFRLFTCGAVSHLFRVAASIDSQILGDMQILGQVKESFERAIAAGAVGPVLHHLAAGSLRTGKRARSETSIGIGAVSVSFAAVELARRIFSDLHRKRVLLIGTGETGTLAARHLAAKGVDDITLANRTRTSALALADELHAAVVDFDGFTGVLHDMDIVISATSAPGAVVTREMVQHAMKHRHNRTLLLIDIALPRDIEPAAGELPGVFLKDLDALQVIVDQNLEKRRLEIPKAELIVTEETVHFFLWLNSLQATPTIQQLREKFEQIRGAELARFRNRIPPEQLETVDMLTKRIVNKLLHPTMVSLKEPAADTSLLAMRLQVLREVFDLDDATETPDSEKDMP